MYYGEFTCKADVEQLYNRTFTEEIIYADRKDSTGEVDVLVLNNGAFYTVNCAYVASKSYWNPHPITLQQLIDEVKVSKYWHNIDNLKEAFENHFHVKL